MANFNFTEQRDILDQLYEENLKKGKQNLKDRNMDPEKFKKLYSDLKYKLDVLHKNEYNKIYHKYKQFLNNVAKCNPEEDTHIFVLNGRECFCGLKSNPQRICVYCHKLFDNSFLSKKYHVFCNECWEKRRKRSALKPTPTSTPISTPKPISKPRISLLSKSTTIIPIEELEKEFRSNDCDQDTSFEQKRIKLS